MIEMTLFTAPVNVWQIVPFTTENHHKWVLKWYRFDDTGHFCFSFISPKGRRYTYYTELGRNGTRVTDAEITLGNGEDIASYCESCGDSPTRLDTVIERTPDHIIDRLYMLLDAIG